MKICYLANKEYDRYKDSENYLNDINLPYEHKNEITKWLNDNFEITSNGMIRLKKKKMQKGETAYLKSRIKESWRNNEV